MEPIKWRSFLWITISLYIIVLGASGTARGTSLSSFHTATPDTYPQEYLPPPPYQNVIQNGDFDSGADHWNFWGEVVWEVQDSVLQFYRPITSTGAAVFQDANYDSAANSPYELSVRLGNTADSDKTIALSLHHPATWDGNIGCVFTIPANSPLQTYVVRGQTDTSWPNIRFEISVDSNDGKPNLLMDDVSVQYKPDITLDDTECLPPVPQGQNVIRNADFSSFVDQWNFWGDVIWEVQDGVLQFYRPITSTAAAVFQDVNYNSAANSPYELGVRLGNTADIDKTITLSLHHPDTWDGSIGCVFTISANSPLQTYIVRGQTNSSWPNIRFEISVSSNDGEPNLLMDDVSVQYRPDIHLINTECLVINQVYLPLVARIP